MNDKLLIENYLLLLKSNTEVYVHGTLESSNDDVRKILHTGLCDTLDHQARVYDEMVSNDWYVVENINPEEIEAVYNKLMNED